MSLRISRRTALGTLAGALAALRVPAAAQAEEKLRVGKSVVENFGYVPLDVGMDTGIFARNGLAIEELTFAGGAKIAQAMAADALDISLSAGPDMAFVAKGAPELAVGAISESAALMAFVVGPQSKAKSMDDLKGARIGITSPGSLTDWLVDEVNRYKGWKDDGVRATKVAIGGANSTQIAALKTGQVDASVVSLQGGYIIEHEQAGRILFDCSTFVPAIELNTIFASTALIQKNPDALRRFLKGWYETIAYMKSHRDETVRIGAKAMNDPPVIVARAYDNLMDKFSVDGKFHRPGLDALASTFVQMKSVPEPFDMTKLYTEQFLPGAAS